MDQKGLLDPQQAMGVQGQPVMMAPQQAMGVQGQPVMMAPPNNVMMAPPNNVMMAPQQVMGVQGQPVMMAPSVSTGMMMQQPVVSSLAVVNPHSDGGAEVFHQTADGQVQRQGTMTVIPAGHYGNSPRIQSTNGGPAPTLLHKGVFQDTVFDCLLPKTQKARQYAYIWDNKLEINLPLGIFGCLTCSEKCVVDRVYTTYFDRSPIRTGMYCFVIPATCCGPPVIYSKEPKMCFDLVSLSPCCGTPIKAAPCDCFGLKTALCCGPPCYENYGMPIVPQLTPQSAKTFISHFQRAVGDYGRKHPELHGELAKFENVSGDWLLAQTNAATATAIER